MDSAERWSQYPDTGTLWPVIYSTQRQPSRTCCDGNGIATSCDGAASAGRNYGERVAARHPRMLAADDDAEIMGAALGG